MEYIPYSRSMVGTKPVIMVGAGVALFDKQNRMLLQKRKDSQTWALHGGFMELRESTEETAKREVFEETGLKLGDLELYKVWTEDIKTLANGDQVQIVHITYVSNDFSGELKAQESEVLELKFFELEDLPSNLFKPHASLIKELALLKKEAETS